MVSAEASVGAEAVVEADLDFGGRFKLASHCRKDGLLCREEMVQALQARDAVQAVEWGEGKARVEAEWVDRTLQDREEAVYARNAQQ